MHPELRSSAPNPRLWSRLILGLGCKEARRTAPRAPLGPNFGDMAFSCYVSSPGHVLPQRRLGSFTSLFKTSTVMVTACVCKRTARWQLSDFRFQKVLVLKNSIPPITRDRKSTRLNSSHL